MDTTVLSFSLLTGQFTLILKLAATNANLRCRDAFVRRKRRVRVVLLLNLTLRKYIKFLQYLRKKKFF